MNKSQQARVGKGADRSSLPGRGDGREDQAVAGLVRAAARGEEAAWAGLVGRFAGLVWSVIQGYRLAPAEAADVSQVTWLRLAEHIHRLREPERVGAWMTATAGRECLRLLRRNQRQIPIDEAHVVEVPGGDEDCQPETGLSVCEGDEELWSAFAALPMGSQVLLRLLFADPPPSHEEIVAATGMRVGSIGPTSVRCLAQLRGQIGPSRQLCCPGQA